MNPSPPYHPPNPLPGASPFTPSPPFSHSSPGVIGEPSARLHGIEPKGEFLLQLLQGGSGNGGRVSHQKASGDRPGERSLPSDNYPHSMGGEEYSTWQLRDPAVAALGPSHSFHAGGEHSAQLLQPNQLFMPPQYGGAGGVWTSQQQQQQHQFFPSSLDPREYGGIHPRAPHQVSSTLFPPYPPPPPPQALEQPPRLVEKSMMEFSRRPDAPWLPPPQLRQGITDSTSAARARGGSIQLSVLKTPLPPPLPSPPAPPAQQFYGNGAELLQLLLGGGTQNSGTHKGQKSPLKTVQGGINSPGGECLVKGATVGTPVGNVTQKTGGMIVHGPIGPPKRFEPTQPARSPPGPEDLLGRFWAASNSSANGSPDPNKIPKPGLMPSCEDHLQDPAYGGGHSKESLGYAFDSSNLRQQHKKYEFFGEQSRPGVLKSVGFAGDRDPISGFPLESNCFSPAAKVLPQNRDFQEVERDKGLLGVWDGFQEGVRDIGAGLGHAARPVDDRAHHQRHHPSSLIGQGRNREEGYQSVSSAGFKAEPSTSTIPTDFFGTSKESEGDASREFTRIGGRVGGRRGSLGRGEVGRRGGRMVTGQWVAVNGRQREREGDREGVTMTSLAQPVDITVVMGAALVTSGATAISSPQTGNSPPPGKEESPNSSREIGSGGKLRDDLKRRRGQTQEWRMKQPSPQGGSPTQSKMSDSPASLDASLQQTGEDDGAQLVAILPLASQVDHPGLPSNMVRHSMPGSAMDESKQQLQHQLHEGIRNGNRERVGGHSIDFLDSGPQSWEDGLAREDEEDLMREFSGYLKLVEETDQIPETPLRIANHPAHMNHEELEIEGKHENFRDSREVRRPQQQRAQLSSLSRGDVRRPDLEALTPKLLAIYKGLIPPQEEVQKRRQFLGHLDNIVSRDWAGAKLFLFGSCANQFGVCNSDIDVCLSVEDEQSSKAELVMKMASILRSDNMQSVQALTHARVPIVKFTDPVTGISCDICVNNMLAVVNSKLLHDYSQIDPRLRQLAFLVKHWAKRRQVNETYRGTLSSYAYVLMCVHFLQQRKPAVLPCLQMQSTLPPPVDQCFCRGENIFQSLVSMQVFKNLKEMHPTYQVTVGKIKCAYYDKVDLLKTYGARNKEVVGELLTAFFEYWAFRHDYNRSVISVRTGGYLSKDEKDWTRRIGNERHLICIEDPFETTHDLGRVVDRHSIRVLRDEFNRAAKILRQDPNPCTTLFEPFIREST